MVDFYHRDDVSRQYPGKSDVRTIININGEKEKERVARRVMSFTLAEAHSLFLKENPSLYVSISKFCSLRERCPDVFLASSKDQVVCAYPIHENMQLMCDACELGKPDDVLKKYSCEDITPNCIALECVDCPISQPGFFTPIDLPETVRFKKWVKGKLASLSMTKNAFRASFEENLRNYGIHMYLKNTQASCLRNQKENLKDYEVLIHFDFAENYSPRYETVVMDAHWNNDAGITIFTAVAYFRGNEGN